MTVIYLLCEAIFSLHTQKQVVIVSDEGCLNLSYVLVLSTFKIQSEFWLSTAAKKSTTIIYLFLKPYLDS
jgi:hypothetical protein